MATKTSTGFTAARPWMISGRSRLSTVLTTNPMTSIATAAPVWWLRPR